MSWRGGRSNGTRRAQVFAVAGVNFTHRTLYNNSAHLDYLPRVARTARCQLLAVLLPSFRHCATMEKDQVAGSKRPRSRQSIAHVPISEHFDKENMTADVSSMQWIKSLAPPADKKKSRSKSLGPGGLEALKEDSGNSRKVWNLSRLIIVLHLTSTLFSRSLHRNRSQS